MRQVLLIACIGGFAGLGVLDILAGREMVGLAALLLAAANYILLV